MKRLKREIKRRLADWKLVSLNLFRVMFFIGLALLPVAAYSYLIGDGALPSLLLTDLVFLAFGLPLLIDEDEQLQQKHAMIIAALAWICIPLVSMIPFQLQGMPLVDAFFEAMSGWTATGLTFIPDITVVPASLLLYRSLIQWIGGLGIVVFALIILEHAHTPQLFRSERQISFRTNVTETVRRTWSVYAALTGMGTILLFVTGVEPFHALNLAMTGLATGGFVTLPSLAGFSLASKVVLIVLMLAGATSIPLFYWLFQGNTRPLRENTEVKAMLAIMAIGSAIIVLWGNKGLVDSLFHATSALTGTGFSVSSLSAWGTLPVFTLTMLMIIGGCSGSTTSALRIRRVLVLFKSTWRSVREVFLPNFAVFKPKLEQEAIEDEDIINTGNYVFIYLFIGIVLVFVLLVHGLTLDDAFFVTFSVQGNVGLNSFADWLQLGSVPKWSMIVSMWLGRLQIFPALILVTKLFRTGRLEI